MKNFLVLTIILMLGAYGRVVAQDAAAASKRANQQYVLFESERDKGTNVTGMYSYLLDSYENFMKVEWCQESFACYVSLSVEWCSVLFRTEATL